MFPYLSSVKDFLADSEDPKKFSEMLQKRVNASCWEVRDKQTGKMKKWEVSDSEVASWENSLCKFVRRVLEPCSPDLAIGIEYFVERERPGRVDLMIAGYGKEGGEGKAKVLVFELKQWDKVVKDPADKEHCIPYKITDGKPEKIYKDKDVEHPAVSLMRYISSIKDHNDEKDNIEFIPVVYCHNMRQDHDLLDLTYEGAATAFYQFKADKDRMDPCTEFIKSELSGNKSYDDNRAIFTRIRNGYKPIDVSSLADLFHSDKEKELDIVQYEAIRSRLRPDQSSVLNEIADHLGDEKHIDIVYGGPGSGKTVLFWLLRSRIRIENYKKKDISTCMVLYEGTAPVNRFKKKIEEKKGRDILTVYSSEFKKTIKDKGPFDYLFFDEFHRYKGTGGKDPKAELIDMIKAVKSTVVLFLDTKQKVYKTDCGGDILTELKDELKTIVKKENIHEYSLRSQFRCNGDDGYVSWVEDKLKMREGDPIKLSDLDFRPSFISKKELTDLIKDKKKGNKAKDLVIVTSVADNLKDKKLLDTGIEKYKGKHGLIDPGGAPDAGFWADVHGVEYDDVIVIIGNDLKYADLDKTDEDTMITKNRYRMLLTRGMKKCRIYCADEKLRKHLEEQ